MLPRMAHLLKMKPPIADNRGLLFASGATKPTDGTDGFQASCYFQDTTNGIAYVNEGSVTSCEFNAVTTGGPADVLTIGAFSSVTAGSGIAISSSQTAAAKVYSDDVGANIDASVRGLLSRFLLTKDQSGGSIRAIMGQLKLVNLIDVTTGIYTANQGYVEIAGTSIVATGAKFSCFDASLEVTTALTVNSGGLAAGIHVETTGAGSITLDATGIMAGIVITKGGTPSWPIGLHIVGPNSIEGIRVGQFVSAASGGGIVLATAVSAANRFYSDDGGVAIVNTGVNDTRGVLSRVLVTTDHSANELRLFALEGQLKTYNATWDNEMCAGVYGYLEITNTGSTTFDGYGFTAGVMSCVENSGAMEIGTNHVLSGFCAVSKITSDLTATGKTAAFHAAIYDGTNWSSSAEDEQPWEYGLLIQDAAAGVGVDIGTCTTGINIAACTNGIVFGGVVSSRIFDYATVTEIDEPGEGHLVRYGASGAPIVWTPTVTCNGLQMNITSTGPAGGGFALAGVRVKVTLTGTTKITANAGNFWTKIACDNYTGDYLGGHPVGLAGIIECAGTLRVAASSYAVMAGVRGEVRPIITASTTNVGGVICGLHAKIFGLSSEVDTGSVVGVLVQAIGSGASDIGILVQPHVGAIWTVGLDFDSVYGAITTAIDIGTVSVGIDFTGTLTDGIMFSNATFAADETRTCRALEIGGRSTAEVDVTFASGTGAVEHFEPIQMNFNLIGANPDVLSTVNIWQGGMFLDTDAMADIRLKWTDLLTTVSQNCTDVYTHQAEVKFSGSPTASGEVAVLGLVLDGGSGSVTNYSWRVINCTLRGAGTPVNSAGIFINQESGCGNVDAAIRIGAGATMTSAFRIGTPEYTLTPTHLFQFPAAGTTPIEAGSYAVGGGTQVRISVLVGGVQYYMLASTNPGVDT